MIILLCLKILNLRNPTSDSKFLIAVNWGDFRISNRIFMVDYYVNPIKFNNYLL